ncbi:discoidin domain-containing protein [Streptacidiphilus sp. N1-3]|uniref:Discoidin domain-containing protein n=1 Tax=Streptacidiphilus alkalitolerans TaxID=3342712 RepID=A0ABV6WXK3_9ACTN
MRTPRTTLLIATSSALVAATLAGSGLGSASAAEHRQPPRPADSAQVWITTPDGTDTMADLGTVDFTSTPADPATAPPTVVVDPSRSFQTMTGFGASITDSSAAVLSTLTPQARTAAMASLFDPGTGDGLDYLRQPVGASDFTTTAAYTYDDVPAGQSDYGLRHFSVAHDQKQILPLLRQAEQLNPQLQILATPWSPPAWMKTGGSLDGGRLIDDPRVYRAYAAYLVKFIQAYRANGVRVDQITVQNEPQNRTPAGYPGTDMPSWQEAKVIDQLGPMLHAAGLKTKILAYDHNWTEHPNDAASTPPDETADINDYPQQILRSSAAKYVSGTAYHCYYGDPSAMTALHNQFPSKDIYFTECSGSQSANPASTFSDTLKWHTRNLVIGATRNWAKTVVNWNIALDPSGGPHTGGCTGCTGVLTVNADGSVTRNAEYYTLGALARFVKPGAVRIASTSFGTTGWNGQVEDTAFRNPDGSTVLVAHNENDNPQTFAVQEGDQHFSYTLPGGALASFVWHGVKGGKLRQADPTGWTATASAAGATDTPAQAVDDDASTRYSSGTGQAPGQYLQVDLGRARRLQQLVLDTGASTGDYPRGYTATTSTDGTHWHTAVADAAGTGQFTTVDLGDRQVRYVRITLTAASGSWWSVADIRGYQH